MKKFSIDSFSVKITMILFIFSFIGMSFNNFIGCANLNGAIYARHWDSQGDMDARYAQELIDSTVRIDRNVVIKNTSTGDTLTREGGGTGVVLNVLRKQNKFFSVVMTARHVCSIRKSVFSLAREVVRNKIVTLMSGPRTIDVEFFALNSSGTKKKAKVYYMDDKSDICVLVVDDVIGNPARIASFNPPVGGMVTYVGAPLGLFHDGFAIVTDGRYSGILLSKNKMFKNKVKFSVSTISMTFGASGGGVFYKGALIGILSMVPGEHAVLSWFATLDDVKRVTEKVNKKLSRS